MYSFLDFCLFNAFFSSILMSLTFLVMCYLFPYYNMIYEYSLISLIYYIQIFTHSLKLS